MRWMIWLALAAALLGMGPGARAHEGEHALPQRALPHHTECPVKLPADFWDAEGAEKFRASEEWAWKQICLGQWADMRNAPGGEDWSQICKPSDIEALGKTVPFRQKLRPEFLELILSHHFWASRLRHLSVVIECGLVEGDIDLDQHTITPSFLFVRGKVDGGVSLFGAQFERTLSFQGSTVTGQFNGNRLQVSGSLYLRDGAVFSQIDLLNAKVNGNVNLNGSTVHSKIQASGITVGGGLLLSEGATISAFDLIGANIGSRIDLSKSAIIGKFQADGVSVGGPLFLIGGFFGDINLPRAKVAGDVDLAGATVSGYLNADGIEVGGYLFLRGGGAFADIYLLGAKVRGSVQLAGSTFISEIDATGSQIHGELHVSSDRLGSPIWREGATLVLRNVRTDAIQAELSAWKMSRNQKEKVPIDLTGFIYNRFGGLLVSSGKSMGEEPADRLIAWIESQHDHGTHYDPQPYEQLAKVLEASGAADKADAIRYAKFEHKRAHDKGMDWLGRAWLEVKRWLVGYGVYPFRALYWFGGLVGLGFLLALLSREREVRRLAFWYSLENALPLVEMNERFKNADHGRWGLASFFHFQKVAGFLLATILVGALTLLGG